MKITVRGGRVADAVELCRLRRRVWLSNYVCVERGITRERILAAYRFSDGESVLAMRLLLAGGEYGEVGVFVAEALLEGGMCKLVGFGVGEREGNRLTMLYVDSVYQGRGIGGRLWDVVRGFLDGGEDIVLRVVDYNESAQKFYLRRGFVFDDGVGGDEDCDALFVSRGMKLSCKQKKPFIE